MGWSNQHWYQAETLDAMLHRIRATADACHGGPEASLDPAREERDTDRTPPPRWETATQAPGPSPEGAPSHPRRTGRSSAPASPPPSPSAAATTQTRT